MTRVTFSLVAALFAGLALSGTARAQATAAERAKRTNDLKQIALAYHVYFDKNSKAPEKAADLAAALDNNKRLIGLLENKDIVFQYGVGLLDMVDGTSNTVLAYEKDVPTKGGVVAMGDGSVKNMTADEFKKAKLATPRKK